VSKSRGISEGAYVLSADQGAKLMTLRILGFNV
jgi:hypothetical protein